MKVQCGIKTSLLIITFKGIQSTSITDSQRFDQMGYNCRPFELGAKKQAGNFGLFSAKCSGH